MHTVNIHEAKTQLSRLVDRANHGDIIVIARAGKPAATLGPLTTVKTVRKLGVLKGHIKIADDFDTPLSDDELADFEGR